MSNNRFLPGELPTPIEWSTKEADAEKHIENLESILSDNDNKNLKLLKEALLFVTRFEIKIPQRSAMGKFWQPYCNGDKTIKDFFRDWLTFTPDPDNPSRYIEYWDAVANTKPGRELVNADNFKPWIIAFFNFHGDWINSTSSTSTIADWEAFEGTDGHPFDIQDYELADRGGGGGYKSFNQFFLRRLDPWKRPLIPAKGDNVIVSPADGGIFHIDNHGVLPGKSGDRLNLQQAIPYYSKYFVGGPFLDILLWFSDYHHFHAPVSGKVIFKGLYPGSYNYDFNNFDPNDMIAALPPEESDRVGWYQNLGKHQRYLWIIETPNLGYVAMIAIGFWGVGSIIDKAPEVGATLERGQYMGHFGYGGSSIVLAFEPTKNITFEVNKTTLGDADHPTLVQVGQQIGNFLESF